jgi:gliding motility-associated lipoprotein GldH
MNKVLVALALFGGLGFLSACNPDRVFEYFQGLQPLRWGIADTVGFETEIDPQGHTISFAVRYNEDYEYHNLYVKYLVTDSVTANTEEKLVNLQLFDPKTGKPLGRGFGNTFTLYEPLPVEQPGQRIQFIQYMRQKELPGIEAVGFKIEME